MSNLPPNHLLQEEPAANLRATLAPTEIDLRQRLSDIVRLVSDIILEMDRNLILTYVSARSAEVLGYQPWEMVGRPLSVFGRFAGGGEPLKMPDWRHPFRDRPFLAVARDGSARHLLMSALPVFDPLSDAFVGVRATAEDLTRRKADEERLRKLSTAVEQSRAAVIITNRDGVIEYVNSRFVQSSGYTAAEALGRTPSLLKSDHMPRSVYRELWKAITAGSEWRGELYNRKKTGEGYWEYTVITPILDEAGIITHFVAIKEDLTERKKLEENLLRQGNEDKVTGLPNRVLAFDRLEQALARARRSSNSGALLLVDLDDFKRVNDVLGHFSADKILREAGSRLATMVRPEDTVARLGGDEFGIIAGDCHPSAIEGLAQRILRAFSSPFTSTGHEIFVTPSVGVTIFPEDAESAAELMRNSDAAVSRAKEMGGNAVQFFTPGMNERARERAKLEAALHHALERGELQMHYQPIVDLRAGRVTGAEALMRWNSAEFGRVPPDQFIPLAEMSGLIVRLGAGAAPPARRPAATWRKQFGADFRMAVNVSTRQVRQVGFADLVLRAMTDSGIQPANLEIEITESLLLDDTAPVGELARLREAGIRLSIDDFGTGYSSLSYLKRFPVDTLKIDRSFVSGLAGGGTDVTLVETIITMAHCLGLDVVAEGVESLDQLDILKGRSCNYAQGFLFGGAVSAGLFDQKQPVL
ncbi:MAG: EAL domain-containing protein [Telmatospirillum sp.]|nr:EAL domain-containing protein [Telmatospirillum sp.]